MTDEQQPEGYGISANSRRLQVTAYCGDLKFTGIAFVGLPTRTTSRRPSDILYNYTEKNLKLADVRVYDRHLDRIIDEPPFIVLNIDRIDAIHAEDIEPGD